jgi:pteridine reductase
VRVITTPVAIVTGSGARRIGWHVADALAARGYALAIHYRTSKDEAEGAVEHLRRRGSHAIAVEADLRDESAVTRLVDTTVERFGRLDVLVNCAAVWPRKRLEEVSADDVRDAFETNTLGTFLCSQRAGLVMVKQPQGGNIILVGDWACARPYQDHAAYFLSKGTIPTLTRTLGIEFAARNPKVRVNAILPGPVMLPPALTRDERRESIEGTLVKREGGPHHIAQTVLFLLDNDFVTGTCITVDGGRTIAPHG